MTKFEALGEETVCQNRTAKEPGLERPVCSILMAHKSVSVNSKEGGKERRGREERGREGRRREGKKNEGGKEEGGKREEGRFLTAGRTY